MSARQFIDRTLVGPYLVCTTELAGHFATVIFGPDAGLLLARPFGFAVAEAPARRIHAAAVDYCVELADELASGGPGAG